MRMQPPTYPSPHQLPQKHLQTTFSTPTTSPFPPAPSHAPTDQVATSKGVNWPEKLEELKKAGQWHVEVY
jgi:hypothetical protein